MTGSLFPTPDRPDANDAASIAQYERTGRSLDDLPYTKELSELCARMGDELEEPVSDEIYYQPAADEPLVAIEDADALIELLADD